MDAQDLPFGLKFLQKKEGFSRAKNALQGSEQDQLARCDHSIECSSLMNKTFLKEPRSFRGVGTNVSNRFQNPSKKSETECQKDTPEDEDAQQQTTYISSNQYENYMIGENRRSRSCQRGYSLLQDKVAAASEINRKQKMAILTKIIPPKPKGGLSEKDRFAANSTLDTSLPIISSHHECKKIFLTPNPKRRNKTQEKSSIQATETIFDPLFSLKPINIVASENSSPAKPVSGFQRRTKPAVLAPINLESITKERSLTQPMYHVIAEIEIPDKMPEKMLLHPQAFSIQSTVMLKPKRPVKCEIITENSIDKKEVNQLPIDSISTTIRPNISAFPQVVDKRKGFKRKKYLNSLQSHTLTPGDDHAPNSQADGTNQLVSNAKLLGKEQSRAILRNIPREESCKNILEELSERDADDGNNFEPNDDASSVDEEENQEEDRYGRRSTIKDQKIETNYFKRNSAISTLNELSVYTGGDRRGSKLNRTNVLASTENDKTNSEADFIFEEDERNSKDLVAADRRKSFFQPSESETVHEEYQNPLEKSLSEPLR